MNYRESVDTTKGAVEVMQVKLPTIDVLEIDVRRNFLLVDALREGKKKKFSPAKEIKARIIIISHEFSFKYTPTH